MNFYPLNVSSKNLERLAGKRKCLYVIEHSIPSTNQMILNLICSLDQVIVTCNQSPHHGTLEALERSDLSFSTSCRALQSSHQQREKA